MTYYIVVVLIVLMKWKILLCSSTVPTYRCSLVSICFSYNLIRRCEGEMMSQVLFFFLRVNAACHMSKSELFFFSVLGNFVHLLRKPLTLPLAYSLRGQSVQLVDGLMLSLPLSLLIMSPPLLSIIFSPTYFSPRYSFSPLYFIHTLYSSPFFSVIIPLFLPLIISSFLIICCSPPLPSP